MTHPIATSRGYPLPHPTQNAAEDATRIRNALLAIDGDVVGLLAAYAGFAASIGEAVADLVGAAPGDLDTIHELAAALQNNPDVLTAIQEAISQRVAISDVSEVGAALIGATTAAAARAAIGAALLDDVLAKAGNLGGLADAAAARTNLGLGNAATKNTGTGAGSVAAGDDARITGAVQSTGDATINGVKTFGSIPVLPNSSPTADNQAARKKYVDDLVKITKEYTSADQTLTSSGSLTLSHGLGAKPKIIQLLLKCTTADGDFAVNDEVVVSNMGGININGDAGRTGATIVITSSEIFIRLTPDLFALRRKDGASDVYITASSWRLIVRAWA